MNTTGPTPSRASSSRNRPPTPFKARNSHNDEEDNSGETEVTRTYQDANTARIETSVLQEEPSVNETLQSTAPLFETTTGSILEGLIPPVDSRPTPNKPPQNTNPLSKLNPSEQALVHNILMKLGKFVGTTIRCVSDARGLPLPTDPPADLTPILQEEDPSVTLTDVWKEFMIT